MKKQALLLGAGGWSREHWIDIVLPDFAERIEIVGLVDKNVSILNESGDILGVPTHNRFNTISEAFEGTAAEFCINVLPPEHHLESVLEASRRNMPMLSEKPISTSHADTLKIYDAVKKAGIKMAIIQNYRYEAPTLTLRAVLASGVLGRIDYIISRYACDYRRPGSWEVADAHNIDDPLLIEGAIHHMDMIRNFSGANCKKIIGVTWNPSWSSFSGDCNALLLLEMVNGVKAVYEGSSLAAGFINRWHQEYYRVECEKGSVSICADSTVKIFRRVQGKVHIDEQTLTPAAPTGHHKIIDDFLSWLDGGPAVETCLSDNIHSAVMVYAAITASRTGEAQTVDNYLPDVL